MLSSDSAVNGHDADFLRADVCRPSEGSDPLAPRRLRAQQSRHERDRDRRGRRDLRARRDEGARLRAWSPAHAARRGRTGHGRLLPGMDRRRLSRGRGAARGLRVVADPGQEVSDAGARPLARGSSPVDVAALAGWRGSPDGGRPPRGGSRGDATPRRRRDARLCRRRGLAPGRAGDGDPAPPGRGDGHANGDRRAWLVPRARRPHRAVPARSRHALRLGPRRRRAAARAARSSARGARDRARRGVTSSPSSP